MPELSTLLVFAAAAAVLTATPGPVMVLIASRSISQGRNAGFMTFAGIAAGTYCHAIAAALGLSQLFAVVPVAYEIVRWAGCAYLLYLAWKALRADPAAFSPSNRMASLPVWQIFSQGLLTNLLNPKMVLFMLALLPQFVDPAQGSVALQMLVLATVLNGIGFFVNGAVIMVGGRLRASISNAGRFRKLPQYLLATVFAGLACRLALGSRG